MGCCSSEPVSKPNEAIIANKRISQNEQAPASYISTLSECAILDQSCPCPVENQADPVESKDVPHKNNLDEKYANKAILKLQDFFIDKLTQENLFREFEKLTGLKIESGEKLYKKVKHIKNLLQNPSGELKFEHWTCENAGQGWEIEDFGCYKSNQTIFASSFEWCSLTQSVIIPSNNDTQILIVGSPVARRMDAESEAKINLEVTTSSGSSESVEVSIDCPYGEPVDFVCPFELLTTKLELKPGSDYTAKVKFSGKDKPYWGGHYGARFGYCFAFLVNL